MSKRATPAPAASEPASYEAALAELDRLVQAMEAAQLPLDELLDSYRRGAQLLSFCRARLEAVEQQVKVLEALGQAQRQDGCFHLRRKTRYCTAGSQARVRR